MKIDAMLRRNISNLIGWNTTRKIIVFDSDDWGSIRMPSGQVFEKLSSKGIDLISRGAERYNRNDTLATDQDLEYLFECLLSFKDKFGHHPVFTAITIVANPDFVKIKESDFARYCYEPFPSTLLRYKNCEKSLETWRKGIDNGIFIPQFHGREHLNITAWMNSLQKGEKQVLDAFDHGFWSIVNPVDVISFQAAFDLTHIEELEFQKSVIKEGLDLFYQIFGYRASYFVPPNGPINNNLNYAAAASGIRQRTAAKIQMEPIGNKKYKKRFHYLGQKSHSGLIYLTRNAFFEPSDHSKDWVDSCLNDIKIAFRWNKPAIISSHRVNYIGAINRKNRDHGLTQLNMLLNRILKEWPDVEFMSSNNLGDLILINNIEYEH